MDIVRQSLAITFVFALLWLALWFLKKRGRIRTGLGSGRGESGLLESRGKLTLSAQHSLHIIRVREREVVLAVHPTGITFICDLGPPAGGSGPPFEEA
jgi:flagellar biogenesis protein FliO